MEKTVIEEGCKNCDNSGYSIFRQQVYCKECYPKTCLHFFRASFGKHRLIRDGEKVLIAVSGGPASMTMLQLVKLGLEEGNTKKLRFHPFFFHLLEGEFEDKEDEKGMEETLRLTGYPHALLPPSHLLPDVSLISVLREKGEGTARHALRNVLRRRALLLAARRFDCSRVLVGDSGTRTAGVVLENMIQGRGAEVADIAAFSDSRFSPTIVRPMLEFQEAECISLVNLYSLPTMKDGAGPLHRKTGMGSLQGLSSRVLSDLQPGFPATNFAIVRTAGKIKELPESLQRCRLCESPVDISESESESAVKDLRFSFDRLSGLSIMKDKELCYGCHILSHKLPSLQRLLEEQDKRT